MCVCCYLQCLVKPAVGAVVLAASSVQHLDGSGAAAGVLGDSGHGSVQAQSEDAALDGSHRLSVGLIWTPHAQTTMTVAELHRWAVQNFGRGGASFQQVMIQCL